MSRLLLLSLLLFATSALAQDGAVSSIETDQAEYAYGETIELRYSITNEGDEPFSLFGASVGCQAEFVFDDFESIQYVLCTTDKRPYVFDPGETGTWTWHIRPASLGLPESSGTHTITGYWGYSGNPDLLAATTTISAPQYLGGRIALRLIDGVTLEDVQDVVDALNAVVIYDSAPSFTWEIEGITLADAVAAYADDKRFAAFAIDRQVGYSDIVFTDDEDGATPLPLTLTAAHPNPFAASTSFTLTVPASGPTLVEAFDLLGRRVAVLHDGPLASGAEHHFTFHAADLPSGLYVVRATGDGFTETRRVTLAR